MRLFYINNLGGGFADHIEVEPGITVGALFAAKCPRQSPEDFLIRVNRMPVAADQILQEGDRLSITPVKIEGAVRLV